MKNRCSIQSLLLVLFYYKMNQPNYTRVSVLHTQLSSNFPYKTSLLAFFNAFLDKYPDTHTHMYCLLKMYFVLPNWTYLRFLDESNLYLAQCTKILEKEWRDWWTRWWHIAVSRIKWLEIWSMIIRVSSPTTPKWPSRYCFLFLAHFNELSSQWNWS